MKRTRWLVSMVTERGVTFREMGLSERLPVGSASGAVASPMQAASNARAGITRKLRETASLRASLKVYVIVQAFRRPPYRGTQPFPLIHRHPWAQTYLRVLRGHFNDQYVYDRLSRSFK